MKTIRIYKFIVAGLLTLFISCDEDRIGENELGTIKGTVVEKGVNIPLNNVRISTQSITSTVFTDSLGKFTIENVPVGDYSVEARVDDYITDFEPATVIANADVHVVFELETSTANNRPPETPVLISPTENELLQSIEAVFQWSTTDPEEDPITYSIELRNDQNNDVIEFLDITDTTYAYSNLILGARYFWQVFASDGINEPVLSPIGTFDVINAPVDNRYLFTRTIEGNNVIFSSDDDGNEFQLTSQNLNSYRPRRNVAANRIAFLQSNGAEVDIYTMKRDGTEKIIVTSSIKPNGFNLNEINFSWPSNSNKIYFPQQDKLYSINSDGQGIQLVYQTLDASLISEVDVSETGNLIVLKTNNLDGYDISIFTIDFSGTLINTILTGVSGAASGLNLSVTNNSLVYSYDISGFESNDYRRLDSRIFLYDFITATSSEISDNKPGGTNDLEPIFSPNEAFVTFTNTSNDGISQKDVYLLEIDIISTRVLLYSNAFMPDWE